MQQTHKGCCQPEERVSAGAGRKTRLGWGGAREGSWVNSWSKEKIQCWGATELLLCGVDHDLTAVGMGNLHPGAFGKEYLCVVFNLLRNSTFFRTSLTQQAGGWGPAEGCSCPSLYRLGAAWDVPTTEAPQGWPRGHPVIFTLLSFLYSPRQIISQCDAAGSGILVHQESWFCAQGEGTREGEIGEYFIGEDAAERGHWVGHWVWALSRRGAFMVSLGTHTFIKVRP